MSELAFIGTQEFNPKTSQGFERKTEREEKKKAWPKKKKDKITNKKEHALSSLFCLVWLLGLVYVCVCFLWSLCCSINCTGCLCVLLVLPTKFCVVILFW